MWGCIPIASSSFWNGSHQFIKVFVVTPAISANSLFDIAFIYLLIVIMSFIVLCLIATLSD